MSHRSRVASDVRTNAPFRVPTRTRTLLIPSSFLGFARSSQVSDVISGPGSQRSEEHTSELQSRLHLVCRLLLEKKKKHNKIQSPQRYRHHTPTTNTDP